MSVSRHDARERDSWRRQISAYIADELAPELRQPIERELRICRECREYYRQERALHDQRRGADAIPPPQALRRELFAKVEREKRSWLPFGWQPPSLGLVITFVTMIALAFLVPSLIGLIRSEPPVQQAVPARLAVQPAVSPLPTMAVQVPAPDTPAATADASLSPLPTAQVRTLAVGGPGLAARAVPPTPVATLSGGASEVQELQVSGRVTEIRRALRLATVRDGNVAITVAFSSDTAITSHPDGQPLTYEQIGIADRVQVTGVTGNAQDTVTALRVRVLDPLFQAQPTPAQSSVVHPRGRTAKVLYLQDGLDGPQSSDNEQASTRQWIDRLTAAGFNVLPVDPSRVAALDLDDVGLVVIGFPATLDTATLGSIQRSAVPVLNADPLYAPALRLGDHADPANPRHSVPGIAVQVAPDNAPVQDLAGVQAVALTPLERAPITVAEGTTVLATLDSSASGRVVWTSNGSRMYFGLWPDPANKAPTALYWTFLDRAVTHLLGA